MSELGISIRFIRQYRPEDDRFTNHLVMALLSCRWLGHTFVLNGGEERCGVCGARNPDANVPQGPGAQA